MFEKFTLAGASDFRQRYNGTFGYFTRQGKRMLTQLRTVHSDGRSPCVEFIDKDDVEYKLMPDSQDETTGFEFLPPKSAWYNTDNAVPLLVTRIASKQYLRGICDRNTRVRDIHQKNQPINFATLGRIFDSKITPREAFEIMKDSKEKASGIAISPQFAVMPAGHIYCFEQVIGNTTYSVESDQFRVNLSQKDLWIQEVTDAFRRSKIKVEFA